MTDADDVAKEREVGSTPDTQGFRIGHLGVGRYAIVRKVTYRETGRS